MDMDNNDRHNLQNQRSHQYMNDGKGDNLNAEMSTMMRTTNQSNRNFTGQNAPLAVSGDKARTFGVST